MLIEESDLNEGEMPLNKIIHGNVLTVLKKLPSNSIDCVITSPPYWAKRDYGDETVVEWSDGTVCQLGLEPTPEMFVDHLIEIFREVKRVLKPHGNVFVVVDDTYSGGESKIKHIPRKSSCLVPERFAIRMVDELGFILRNKIIWAKKVHIYKERTTVGNAIWML